MGRWGRGPAAGSCGSRQVEHPAGDDIALDLRGTAVNSGRQRLQMQAAPVGLVLRTVLIEPALGNLLHQLAPPHLQHGGRADPVLVSGQQVDLILGDKLVIQRRRGCRAALIVIADELDRDFLVERLDEDAAIRVFSSIHIFSV